MKYAKAVAIGRDMGLDKPAEFVNNIFLHFPSVMPPSWNCEAQMAELVEDAKANGVRFSKQCGDAILAEDSEDDYCYICQKLRQLQGGPKE